MIAKASLIDQVNTLRKTDFLTRKAGSFSGVPPRTVQSWTEKGFIIPDISDTTGTGSKRRYGIRNCIEIGIIKSLTDNRITLKIVKGIMQHLREADRSKGSRKLMPKLDSVLAARAGFLIVRIDRNHVVGFTVHLSHLISHQIFDISSHPEWDKILVIDIKRIGERVLEKVHADSKRRS